MSNHPCATPPYCPAMQLTDDVCGFYAGLDKEGHVIQVFGTVDCGLGMDALENAAEGVVSIGYVEGIPTGYEAIFDVPE